MTGKRDQTTGRDAQRLQTRERVLGAAVAEFGDRGAADADLSIIAASAGVSRGTFYFHFPTKEHVLLELEQREEARIARELTEFLETPRDLESSLSQIVELTLAIEERLGNRLFKDLLALYFSPTRPLTESWREHALIGLVVDILDRARDTGEAEIAVDPYHGAAIFLLGLYGLLSTTSGAGPLRTAVLDSYLTTTLRGLQPR
jgi:TetR/AcrR family transcriptional regulator, repressor for uid operon